MSVLSLHALSLRDEILGGVLSSLPLVVAVLDAEGRFLASEGQSLALLGLRPGQVVGQSALEIYRSHPDVRSAIERALRGESFTCESRLGGVVFDTYYHAIRDAEGRLESVVVVAIDRTHHARTLEALTAERDLLDRVRSISQQGLWDWDLETGTVHCNPRCLEILGFLPDVFDGTIDSIRRRIHPSDLPLLLSHVEDMLAQGGSYSVEYRVHASLAGPPRWILDRGCIARRDDAGRPVRLIGSIVDVTLRHEHEARLRLQAQTDPLTGLMNRGRLAEVLEAQLQGRSPTAPLCLMYVDLDDFKEVNDLHGHEIGDQLLQAVVGRFRRAMANYPDALLARQGGDEFVFCVHGVGGRREALRLGHHVIETLARPFAIGAQYRFRIGASVGIALFPDHGTKPSELLRRSDAAMYQAKRAGRNLVELFDPSSEARASRSQAMLERLHGCWDRNELFLLYQPKVDPRSGVWSGVEALARWRLDGQEVSPSDFIPLAERSGLIVPLGLWVLGEACRQVAAWQRAGVPISQVAVNVSPVQFRHPGFIEAVIQALAQHRLDGRCLELEVTEGVLMQDPQAAHRIVQALREHGVSFSIDDFGTGFSSLSYLRQLAVQALKIDREFIRTLLTERESVAIVRAIVQLADGLGLQTIAEGVEEEAEAQLLGELGCHRIQGFFYSRPLPPAVLVERWPQANGHAARTG